MGNIRGSLGVLRFYGHGVPVDIALALRVLRRGCDGEYGQACTNLGILYALGRGVEKDESRGLVFFEKACAFGSDLGCSSQCQLCLLLGDVLQTLFKASPVGRKLVP
ncbi:MAG: sel1 repeat family protein [Deltaproteobacteria bacterium]|nr:sel1 repeat family protein [Deltaproteobacteria bacterium]